MLNVAHSTRLGVLPVRHRFRLGRGGASAMPPAVAGPRRTDWVAGGEHTDLRMSSIDGGAGHGVDLHSVSALSESVRTTGRAQASRRLETSRPRRAPPHRLSAFRTLIPASGRGRWVGERYRPPGRMERPAASRLTSHRRGGSLRTDSEVIYVITIGKVREAFADKASRVDHA